MNSSTMSSAAESCRVDAVQSWIATDVPLVGQLQTIVQQSDFFAAKAGCQSQINAYNLAAGRTCLLQQQQQSNKLLNESSYQEDNNTMPTYSEFWMVGASDLDGEYTLAWDFFATNNFTTIPALNVCSNDCYVSPGGMPGCVNGAKWLTQVGTLSQDWVCDSEWYGIDNAWNDLRVCSAKVVNDTDAMIDAFIGMGKGDASCASKACNISMPSLPTKCFDSGDELRQAVEDYIDEDCANNDECNVQQKYGLPINSWCVGNVTDMKELFYGNGNTFNGDISAWDVSRVTNMYGMFNDADKFNADLSNWITSSVTNMAFMFDGAYAFNSNISGWDISSVEDMENMFLGAESFNQDLCAWGDGFPYDSESYIFSGSGCTFQDNPKPDQKGPFCASTCGTTSPASFLSVNFAISSFVIVLGFLCIF